MMHHKIPSTRSRVIELRKSEPAILQNEIARRLGIGVTTVSHYLVAAGLNRNTPGAEQAARAKELVAAGLNNHEVRQAMGIPAGRLALLKRQYGFTAPIVMPGRVGGTAIPSDQVEAIRAMVARGLTQEEIGAHYCVTQNAVSYFMNKHLIEPRHRGDWWKTRDRTR